jgi:hypothetical protein
VNRQLDTDHDHTPLIERVAEEIAELEQERDEAA